MTARLSARRTPIFLAVHRVSLIGHEEPRPGAGLVGLDIVTHGEVV